MKATSVYYCSVVDVTLKAIIWNPISLCRSFLVPREDALEGSSNSGKKKREVALENTLETS